MQSCSHNIPELSRGPERKTFKRTDVRPGI